MKPLQPLYLLGAALYMALIFYLSAQPGDAVGIPAPWDKLVHGAAYALLGGLLQRALGKPALAWGIAALYGLSDEVHQHFVPGRRLDPADWLADCTGAAMGVWLVWRR